MKQFAISLLLLALLLAGCTTPTATPTPAPSIAPTEAATGAAQIANPASENCIAQGGRLAIETRGDGGQIGVCYFEDNLQCEEWAMMRGDCPVGGVKVTGYVTEAARYCAITGGAYTITGNSGASDEQGACTFKNGASCDVWDYYNGQCNPDTASTGGWQTHTNAEAGFSIQTPPAWNQQALPDQNDGAIHGEVFSGSEGGVEVYWGVGFGGVCTTGTQPVQLAQGEATACYTKNNDGTEVWSQIGYQVSGGASFSVRAYTSNAQQSSHDLALQVLSTLTFMPPTGTGMTIQPLSMEVCDGQAQAMAHTLEVLVGTKTTTPIIPTQSEAPLEDWVNNASGAGCMATVTGAGELYESPSAVAKALGEMLIEQGWTEDPQLQADGPTGTSLGYRKGNQISLAGANWEPDESANCPKDKPVSACAVTPAQKNYTITLNSGEEISTGQASTTTGMANPASVNCTKQGGTLSIEARGDGGQYGVCYFEDNRQCEEWALFRGDCPVGGLKVTGLVTPAAQYCAITGGTYTITGNSNTDNEQGACKLKDGTVCDVWDYYNGKCSASQADAGQLVFDSTRGGAYRDLYTMNVDGSDVKRLTQGDANSIAGPWSPDGQQIVYTAFGLTNSYIAVIDADGAGQAALDQVQGSDEGFPAWSPDGAQIAFTSRRDGNNEVYLMNADGTKPVRLTNEPGDDFAPGWSPDGSKIVFVSDRDQTAGVTDLYIMNADGGGVTRLTKDAAIDYSPAWSPDGKIIAYRSDQDGNSDIYVINVDGSNRRKLTDNPAYDWSPAWSPDGKMIAFQTNRDGNFEIYLMKADGSDPVNLTNDPGDDQMPFWQPASAVQGSRAVDSTQGITARMLVQPNALMGPSPASFNWNPNGALLAYVDSPEGRDVLTAYDAASGDKKVLLDPGDNPDQIDLSSTLWSPQGDAILLNGGAALWLLDPQTGKLKSLAEGDSKTGLQFSSDGKSIAYVQDNNLYTINISDGKIVRLTNDGSETVFNGALDWVYNEELATRSAQPAYAWSPDGKWLIHLRLDEAEVQNHSVTDYQTVPPTLSYTRYPVAGSANPKATLHMIAIESGVSAAIPLEADVEYILPFFTWFPDSQEAVYVTENRAHTVLELKAWNPVTGKGRTLIKETDPVWINENSYAAPIFLDNGNQFLWLSERDGFMHLYLYSREGNLVRQVTQGNWMIDSPAWNLLIPGQPVFVDPAEKWAYFSATKNSPLERQIYRADIASGALEQVSQPIGFHFGALSGDGSYLVDQFSDVSTPPVTYILKADGTPVNVLGQSAGPTLDLPDVSREFVILKAHDGVDLYAQMVKPENFDPSQKYPVIVHWYAGPTLQMVSDRYGKTNLFNHIERDVLYTQAGFIVWRLDNRGSFGRGHAFETPIAGELGKAALDDQLAGIEYLKTLPYIDASRIGCDGKSFGGYMSLYALIHAPEVFKAGVVGSAPTKWDYYDTIYTERYMQTPAENSDGYAATDLIAAADQLKAAPLIIHGLNDTNVHLQNSINLIQKLESIDKPFFFLPLPNLNHSYKGDGLATALSTSVEYFSQLLKRPLTTTAPASETTPAAPATSSPAASTDMIPLKDALGDLQPKDVFQNFYDLTQTPRPSGSMDKIRAFLVDFGKGLELETVVDEAGNVIIRKQGATGFEDKPGVVLQAHMDMVAQKNADKEFDFTTDPIEAFVNGDYVVTDGTTLGADDGIGMAMIMAVLQSKDLNIGPVEALFTVDEETTMSGALGLSAATLQGRTLINLDWETEGIFTIGAAGGEHVNINSTYKQVPAPTDMVSYVVKVQGLQGGHSGMSINEGLGHATKLMVRLLEEAVDPYGLRLASLVGGTATNAIPREAEAIVFLANNQVTPFTDFVKQYEATIQAELAATEPDLNVTVDAVQSPANVMDETFQKTVIDALYGTPQGVIRMSDTVPGLVETSTNLGITTIQDGQMQIISYPRSSVDSELKDVAQMIASVWELAGYPVDISDYYTGWTPNPDSPILGLMTTAYHDLYDKDPEVTAIHAGLECGAIGGTYPDMDMIAIGPTLNDVHSPSESLYIPSAEKVMNLLLETLQRFSGQ